MSMRFLLAWAQTHFGVTQAPCHCGTAESAKQLHSWFAKV
jgi:hypothetical protein